MSVADQMLALAKRSKAASRRMISTTPEQRSEILVRMAQALRDATPLILRENAADLEQARESGVSKPLLDRLMLTEQRIAEMARAVEEVAALSDPVGILLERQLQKNGLQIDKVRVPLGVVLVVYESRPNVTAEAAALCVRSGNAVLLRGGSEALRSNQAIARALQNGGVGSRLPEDAVLQVPIVDRAALEALAQLEEWIDLMVLRGGEGLVRRMTEIARVPVIKHYKGVCHIFVDASADLAQAVRIIENAKCQRPGVCNAVETLLVDSAIADAGLPMIAEALFAKNVTLRGDQAARQILPQIEPASEDDWSAEYLDLILSIRVVPSLEAAIEHINFYGSHHSDSILTRSVEHAEQFVNEVDSAAVYVNASTRFTDGGQFGMGAEIGISTDKLHVRGPMGANELTTYKYIVRGDGQIRD